MYAANEMALRTPKHNMVVDGFIFITCAAAVLYLFFGKLPPTPCCSEGRYDEDLCVLDPY
jgi:hypothetical protein